MSNVQVWLLVACAAAAAACTRDADPVLTFSGSVVGRESDVLRAQIDRFRQRHPLLRVDIRATPDAADQRHQLYVQWLNARASEPDVLQLDVIWTAEFAAAGWLAPLDRFAPPVADFFPAAVAAHRWAGSVFALPWFVNVGMLYRRTDLSPRVPRDLDDLMQLARDARRRSSIPFGVVWQGARYEGLVTTFLEYLGAFGGAILDTDAGRRRLPRGDPGVDIHARRHLHRGCRAAGRADLAGGADAICVSERPGRLHAQLAVRVWAAGGPLAIDRRGPFCGVGDAGQDRGAPAAALGGSALAINAHSDQLDEAYLLIEYLLQPEQMIDRARIAGQYPPRPALYTHEGAC